MLNLIALLLLVASWLQPLHILPWVTWHSELTTFLAVLFMAWQVVPLRGAPGGASFIPVKVPVTALPLIGLGALVCLQWFFGKIPFFGDALVYCLYYLLCVVAMVLGYHSALLKDGQMLNLAGTLLVAAVISAFIALTQVHELSSGITWMHSMPWLRRPGANLGQPNLLATLILMGFASLLFFYESRKLGAIALALIVLVLTLGLAATESRSGLLSAVVLMVWWSAKRAASSWRLNPWALGGFALFLFVVFFTWPLYWSEFAQTKSAVTVFNNPVAFNRWMIWPQLFQAVGLRPWFGWGMGQVSAAHNAVLDAYDKSESYTYAHNIVLDFALGVGLPFTALFLLVVCAWLWRRLRADLSTASWYCVAVVLPVAIHSLVEFPFAYAQFLVPVMFFIGAFEAHAGSKPIWKIPLKGYVGVLLLASATFVHSAIEYLAIEEDFRIMRFETLRYGTTPTNYTRPNVYLFTQLDALLYGGRLVPRPNMPIEEIELARKVALRFPWIATQNRYALSLALNGNQQEAVRQLRAMRAQIGEKAFLKIKEAWAVTAQNQYPQLGEITWP